MVPAWFNSFVLNAVDREFAHGYNNKLNKAVAALGCATHNPIYLADCTHHITGSDDLRLAQVQLLGDARRN